MATPTGRPANASTTFATQTVSLAIGAAPGPTTPLPSAAVRLKVLEGATGARALMGAKAITTKAAETRILSPIRLEALRLAYAAAIVLTATDGWSQRPLMETAYLPLFAVLSRRIKALPFYTRALEKEIAAASSWQTTTSRIRLVEWLSPVNTGRWPLLETS